MQDHRPIEPSPKACKKIVVSTEPDPELTEDRPEFETFALTAEQQIRAAALQAAAGNSSRERTSWELINKAERLVQWITDGTKT